MTFTIDELFAAAEQELAAWKSEGEKLRTDFDYEKLGFLRAVAERLPSVSQNSGKPYVSGSLPLPTDTFMLLADNKILITGTYKQCKYHADNLVKPDHVKLNIVNVVWRQ